MHTRLHISIFLMAVITALAPVLVASPAQAATLRTWERLARCESGGRWHLNTHNGYYGGLQFPARTWRGYGGKRFAWWPHNASKAQQIRIGERVRRGQGWRAWPYCSRKVGLR